jgi:hypothetical protein
MSDVNRQDTVRYDADEIFAETQDRLSEAAGERRPVRRRREHSPAQSVSTGRQLPDLDRGRVSVSSVRLLPRVTLSTESKGERLEQELREALQTTHRYEKDVAASKNEWPAKNVACGSMNNNLS